MLESWEQLRNEFGLTTAAAGSLERAGGRLKNNLATKRPKVPRRSNKNRMNHNHSRKTHPLHHSKKSFPTLKPPQQNKMKLK